jgi:ribosomal protein S12 methylthiotransferase accessory factor
LAADQLALASRHEQSTYHDRVISPKATVARARAILGPLGITRVAKITDLDRIGIPVFLAVRPGARTLAVTQGKSLDDDGARASAIMEAAEQAVAENPSVATRVASLNELYREGAAHVEPSRFLRRPVKAIATTTPLTWIEGFDLISRQITWMPLGAAKLDFTDEPSQNPFWQSSDGLAAGNILLEAVVHGLCERIERDASALWSFSSTAQIMRRCVDPRGLANQVVLDLVERVIAAGLNLRLFDITSDIGVPTYFSVISETHPTGSDWRHFDLARGTGCHPDPARAAIRAITEAAQSRLTAISGARDDFLPSLYDAPLQPDLHVFRTAIPQKTSPPPKTPDRGPQDFLPHLLTRLNRARIGSVVVVPLGGEDHGISVAKVVVPDLEDPPESRHRQIGRRAINAMLAT